MDSTDRQILHRPEASGSSPESSIKASTADTGSKCSCLYVLSLARLPTMRLCRHTDPECTAVLLVQTQQRLPLLPGPHPPSDAPRVLVTVVFQPGEEFGTEGGSLPLRDPALLERGRDDCVLEPVQHLRSGPLRTFRAPRIADIHQSFGACKSCLTERPTLMSSKDWIYPPMLKGPSPQLVYAFQDWRGGCLDPASSKSRMPTMSGGRKTRRISRSARTGSCRCMSTPCAKKASKEASSNGS